MHGLKFKMNITASQWKTHEQQTPFHGGTGVGPTKAFPVTSLATTVGEMLQVKMTGEPSIFDSDVSIAPELVDHEGYGNELIRTNNYSKLWRYVNYKHCRPIKW